MAAIILLISILTLLLIYGISCMLCIKILNNQEKPEYYLFFALIPIFHIIYLINSRKYLKKEYEKDDYSATNPNAEDEEEEEENYRGGNWGGFENEERDFRNP